MPGRRTPDGLRGKYMTVYPHAAPFLRIHRSKYQPEKEAARAARAAKQFTVENYGLLRL